MAAEQAASRLHIPLLGIDILTIRGPENVTRALATGDLVRFTDAVDTIAEAQWVIRWFFPMSRFFSAAHGFFIPFRSRSDSTYAPCRDFLQGRLNAPLDLSAEVRAAAQLIADPAHVPADRALATAFTRALAARFVPHVPQRVLDAAAAQAGSVGESFLPWKFVPALREVPSVYDFFGRATADDAEVPRGCVTDMAHTVMAGMHFGADIMRALAVYTEDDVGEVMAGLGPTKDVLRMARRTTTLNGLVPEGSAISNTTVVLLNIRDAARSSGDVAWVFGTGTERERCCAENAILGFLRQVQAETLRIRRERNGAMRNAR